MLTRKFRLLVLCSCCLLFLMLAAGYVFAGLQDNKPEAKPLAVGDYRINTSTRALPSPKNLTCQAGDNRIDLSWGLPGSTDVTGFLVYRWLTGEIPAVIASLPPDSTSWSDLSVQNGTRYFYLVVSVGAGSTFSGVDAQAIATPVAPPPPPPEVVTEEEESYYDYEEEVEETPSDPAPAPLPAPAPAPLPDPAPCPPAPGGG